MTPDEARSLGRAIRAVRLEHGLSQLKLAVAIGVKSPWISAWERGQSKPTAHGPAATPSAISKDQLAAIADALDSTVGDIAARAALSASTRLMLGLEPLGAARTVIGGQEFDLTDAEADKAAAFVAGLIAARDLH
ncbi:helix-turn-helix transcriptional regulator [Dietzia cinnamea]|uniref:helix-turn-helix transcriptional regulator n=1 Tax=Dietzia cinnamea TaxID=321318 RepID=UPI00223BCFA6|nr:helix-turn-helix transcriptional regulator [Dietzia cinnamea]MCT2061249.1 helix-turn-helix domain-containing protein [Dietzia cinnamea]MCT2235159.1 helix-turn-helix domain-containing protein [Dietzia cinnamea]